MDILQRLDGAIAAGQKLPPIVRSFETFPGCHDYIASSQKLSIIVQVEGQTDIVIYEERHDPIEENSKVWLKLRPDGHSAWASDWSDNPEFHDSASSTGRGATLT